MIFWIKLGVFLSFIFALVFFIYLVFQTFSFGRRIYYSQPKGKESWGIFYALGPRLLPWGKESASRHPGIYFMGIAYHSGILAGFVFLGISLLNLNLGSFLRFVFIISLAIGLSSGLGLFIRRVSQKSLRFISRVDDYLANLLVDLFLASALGYLSGLISQSIFLISSIILFLYLPLGKIRHCLFFFISHVFWGRFFGRRGIFPYRIHRTSFSGARK